MHICIIYHMISIYLYIYIPILHMLLYETIVHHLHIYEYMLYVILIPVGIYL